MRLDDISPMDGTRTVAEKGLSLFHKSHLNCKKYKDIKHIKIDLCAVCRIIQLQYPPATQRRAIVEHAISRRSRLLIHLSPLMMAAAAS